MTAKKIALVVDFQHDFLDFAFSKLPIPDSKQLVPKMIDYLGNLDPNEYEAVVFTQDWHDADYVEYMPDGTPYPSHCVKETVGADIAVPNPSALAALSGVQIPTYYIKKNVFDMWEESTLFVLDGQNNRGSSRDQLFDRFKHCPVEVSGVALNVCVDFAVKGLINRGFDVTVLKDLTAGLDLGNGEEDVDAVARYKGTNVKVV